MKDEELMKIKNPKKFGGSSPDAIVHNAESWAIAAMHWGKDPVLGIRWTEPAIDYPMSRMCKNNTENHRKLCNSIPRWLVIPKALAEAILNELQHKSNISEGRCKAVKEFLNKKSANYGNCDVLQQALAS